MEILQQKNVTPVNAKLLCYLDQLNLILVSIWPISFWPMLNLPWRGIIEYGRKQEEKKNRVEEAVNLAALSCPLA